MSHIFACTNCKIRCRFNCVHYVLHFVLVHCKYLIELVALHFKADTAHFSRCQKEYRKSNLQISNRANIQIFRGSGKRQL